MKRHFICYRVSTLHSLPLVSVSLVSPSKGRSCNLCHKFNYATIKGCDGKSYAEGKHSLFSLPPFRLGKLGHSIISQLVHLWAAKVIGDGGEISAVAKVSHSPQQSLEQNASMKITQRRWRRRRVQEERSKVLHSLAQGFMGLLPAATLCSESAAP